MTRIRIANGLFFVGLALQSSALYLLYGPEALALVLGSEAMFIGLMGILYAR